MYKRLVEEFEEAVRIQEMVGAQPIEDRPQIERRYTEAKLALLEFFQKRGLPLDDNGPNSPL